MRLGEGRVPVERTEEHGIFIWWEMKETERGKERNCREGKGERRRRWRRLAFNPFLALLHQ